MNVHVSDVAYLFVYLAGALQMIYYHQSSEGATSGDQLGQITLPQFRAIMQAAKVINARFLAEKVLRRVIHAQLLKAFLKYLSLMLDNAHSV